MGSVDKSISLGDIVAFNECVDHVAGMFCHARGITGKVLRQEADLFVLDMNLNYEVFAKLEQLVRVAARCEIPEPIDIGG